MCATASFLPQCDQATSQYLAGTVSNILNHLGDTLSPLFLHGMNTGKAPVSQAVHRSDSRRFTTWIEANSAWGA